MTMITSTVMITIIITGRAEGIPLYAVETIRSLIDRGVVKASNVVQIGIHPFGRHPGLSGLAQGAFAATFRGPRSRFWQRMTLIGLGLGSLALLTSRPARQTRIGPQEVALGLGSAAALYATFRAGDTFARRFVPGGDAQIRDIYTLRTLRPKPEIAARLATIVGPAEELFWRGLVQEALMDRYGRWSGAAAAFVSSFASASANSSSRLGM